jgi:hypothetical protein
MVELGIKPRNSWLVVRNADPSNQCLFERLCKAWRRLQYEPKHVADAVCSYQYLTCCVWQLLNFEITQRYGQYIYEQFYTVQATSRISLLSSQCSHIHLCDLNVKTYIL